MGGDISRHGAQLYRDDTSICLACALLFRTNEFDNSLREWLRSNVVSACSVKSAGHLKKTDRAKLPSEYLEYCTPSLSAGIREKSASEESRSAIYGLSGISVSNLGRPNISQKSRLESAIWPTLEKTSPETLLLWIPLMNDLSGPRCVVVSPHYQATSVEERSRRD
jgi:hypothetical protein